MIESGTSHLPTVLLIKIAKRHGVREYLNQQPPALPVVADYHRLRFPMCAQMANTGRMFRREKPEVKPAICRRYPTIDREHLKTRPARSRRVDRNRSYGEQRVKLPGCVLMQRFFQAPVINEDDCPCRSRAGEVVARTDLQKPFLKSVRPETQGEFHSKHLWVHMRYRRSIYERSHRALSVAAITMPPTRVTSSDIERAVCVLPLTGLLA